MIAQKKKILIVEDDPHLLNRIRMGLGTCKFELYSTTDGQDALEIIRKQPPDLIVLDIILPGFSGYEICKKVKEDPLTSFIPVLMISGNKKTARDRVHGLNVGGDD